VCVCVHARARVWVCACTCGCVCVPKCLLLDEKAKTDSNLENEIKTLLRSVMVPTMKIDGANRLAIYIEIFFRTIYLRRWSNQVPLKRRYTFTIPHCITSNKRRVIIYIAKKAFWLSLDILYEASFLHKFFSYNILCSTIFRWNSWILYLALSYKIRCLKFILRYAL
jgi:hypothetical protein